MIDSSNPISEVSKRTYRAYFKTPSVAKRFRVACKQAGRPFAWVSPRPHGWVVHWA